MRKNNKIIVIISIILILAIIGAIFAYLFLATDVFKSNRELFAKYFVQELQTIEKITQFETVKGYQNLTNETKYESTTDIKVVHSEGGEVSNPLNNLSMKLDIQKDDEQQYFYGNGQISYLNEIYLAAELIKDQEQYGIRFPEAFKQFVTINQNEDIEPIADCLAIDASILETIIQIMDGSEEIISEEQIETSKDKYLNIIRTEISNGIFEKQRNAMITYNNETTKTNAYSVSLTSEQVGKILEEISEKTLEDIEVPTVKITIYEQDGQTIRTVIEIDENKIIIENKQQAGEIKTEISYSDLNNEETIEYHFEITKTNTDTQENIEVVANVLEGEMNYEIAFISKMQVTEEMIDLDIEISHKQDITTISLILENEVNIGNGFEKNQVLAENNFKSLSSIQDETKRKQIVDLIKQIVVQQSTGKIVSLMGTLMLNQEESGEQTGEETTNEGPSQSEINNFNAKFEFYTGEEVSSENVKILLDIIKGNCNGHSIATIEPSEETETDNKTAITLYIQEGATNDESIQEALNQIYDDKKYKVLITYKENNGLIDYITITEI